jgi:hypothetical protein
VIALWFVFFMLALACGIVLGALGVVALAIRNEGSAVRRSQAAARRICGAHMAPPESIFISPSPFPVPNGGTCECASETCRNNIAGCATSRKYTASADC